MIKARANQLGMPYEEMEKEYLQKISLRRMVTAEDVAAMVLFLVSPMGRVSGQSIGVCGNVEPFEELDDGRLAQNQFSSQSRRRLRKKHCSNTRRLSGKDSPSGCQHPALAHQPAYHRAMHLEQLGYLALTLALIDHAERMRLLLGRETAAVAAYPAFAAEGAPQHLKLP
jgi:hypothetical protein